MKKILPAFLGVILLLSYPQWSGAQSAAFSLYQRANQAYQEGKYQEAIRIYKEILEMGLTNGAVLYNLGNAYYKDNQLGQAILFYERAKRLLPRDQDVAANLALAKGLTVDKITTARPSLTARVLTWLARFLNIEELTKATFALYLMTATLVIVAVWFRAEGIRKKLVLASLISGLLLVILAASLLGNIYKQKVVRWAIVLSPSADARSGPGEEYTKIFAIHEGTKIRIRQQRENWYLISLPNGLAGWVPEDVAEII